MEAASLVWRSPAPEASKGRRTSREAVGGARRAADAETRSAEGGTEVHERIDAADLTPQRAATGEDAEDRAERPEVEGGEAEPDRPLPVAVTTL